MTLPVEKEYRIVFVVHEPGEEDIDIFSVIVRACSYKGAALFAESWVPKIPYVQGSWEIETVSTRYNERAVETAARKWWESQIKDSPANRLTGRDLKPWGELHPSTRVHIIEDVKTVLEAYNNGL